MELPQPTLQINPLEEEIFVCPLDEPTAKLNKAGASVPITLTYEDWQKWKETKKHE
jgi:hypothetical protein